MINCTIHISEIMGGRMDTNFYHPKYMRIVDAIKKIPHERLGNVVHFSTETWNQKDMFKDVFPYIEIGAIDTLTGHIKNVEYIPVSEAPSRAKKIAKENDILISTTRPNRGAITLFKEVTPHIASTGFSIIREVKENVLREYIYIVLRLYCSLVQMEQRASGGNYPAITEEELKKILIPTPCIKTQQKIIELYSNTIEGKTSKNQQIRSYLDGIDIYLINVLGIEELQDFVFDKCIIKNISELIGNRLDVSFHRKCFDMKSRIYPNKKLSSLVEIDPTIKFSQDSDTEISFVPMECIDEEYGEIRDARTTLISKTKGYTKFEEGDLLWAKITPCMQNGKSAIARNLVNGVGCGSTEYYVMRPKNNEVLIDYVYMILRHKEVLKAAQNSFGGSAGQQRVSRQYMNSITIPLPPLEKQQEIVNNINTMKLQAKQLQKDGTKLLEEAKQKIEQIILG